MRPVVKICCISSTQEAQLAIQYGAGALGLVAAMPSGPGIISEELIKTIASGIPAHIDSFLLTPHTRAADIISQHQLTRTTTLQLVDAVSISQYQLIKSALSAVKIVQVIHVIDETSIDEALAVTSYVDYLLLDSGNPKLAIKELGGTGRVHNWAFSRDIVRQSSIPVFLAGGLYAGNVREAIDKVQPYGLDLCSGVRTNKLLDEEKLNAFFAAVNF